MVWENTKLLLGLLYRPVSSMGRIVDEGHWLYAAIVVAALSMVFHATVNQLAVGSNLVGVRVNERALAANEPVTIEMLEVQVRYK